MNDQPTTPTVRPSLASLKETLDACETWPSTFIFKFIVKREAVGRLHEIFSGCEVSVRPSRYGTYVGLTAHVDAADSGTVISIYQAAAEIPGIISL
jgi:putative lipoic acid-binding regulatory protein